MAPPQNDKRIGNKKTGNQIVPATQPQSADLAFEAATYRELFTHSIDGVLLTTPIGEILYANPAVCDLLGYTEAELQAGGRGLVADPNDPRLPALLAERQRTGQVRGILTFIRRDGTRIEGEVSSAVFTSAAGQVRTSMFIRDITETTQTKAALRDSERRYRSLVEQGPDIIYQYALTGGGVYYSPQVETILGYTPEQLAQNPYLWQQSIHPDDLTKVNQVITNFEAGQSFELEYRIIDAWGREHWFLDRSISRYDSERGVIIEGVVTDITERKQTQESLRKSEERFRAIVHSTSDIIYTLDTEQRHTGVFGDWVWQSGLTPEMFYGKSAGEILGPENAAIHQEYNARALAGEQVIYEWSLQTDGEPWHYQTALSPLRNEAGVIYGLVGVGRDITGIKQARRSLQESEYRLSLARTAGKIGIWDLDLVTDNLIWDERMYEMYGVEPDTFGGAYAAWQQGVHPDDLARADAEVRQAIRDNQEFHTEFRIVRPSGEVRYIEAHGLVIYHADGRPVRMVGLNTDVTERKQTEHALRDNEEKLRRLVQNIHSGIVVHAPDTHIVLANERASMLLGLTIEQLMGKMAIDPAWRFVHDDGSFMPVEEYPVVQVLAKKAPIFDYVVGINRSVTKDLVWVLVNAFPEITENGTIRQIVVTFVDITDLKRTEKALRQSEENLRITLNSIGDAVIATDTSGRIVRINPVAEQLTGWSQAQAFNQPFNKIFTLIQTQNRKPVIDLVDTVLETGQVADLSKDMLLIARDGREYHVTNSGAPIKNAQGDIMGVVLVLRNVTREIRTEQELLKVRQLESLGLLAGGIAHDFNNLLAALSGNLELARLGLPSTHKSYRYVDAALSAGERAVALSNQLLTFAKGGAPVKEIQDLGHVLTETATFIMHGSKSRLKLEIAPDLWLAEVDRGQVSQVIGNLVINAQQAMPTGGTITLKAANIQADGQPYVKITVRDEGTGIAPEYLEKIFDPYFSTKSKNSGLGLTTVQSIIAKHNGQITVSSQLHQGTTFDILLPASPQATPAGVFAEQESNFAQIDSARVLVLDDDEMIRVLLEEMLTQIGYQVTLTEEGRAAIDAYREAFYQGNPYQAVILDLTIPGGMGGQEVAGEILTVDSQARLVVSSGYANDPILANYKAHGFKAQIQKPYRLATLQQTLRKVMN